ncbi:dTMP kinase [Nematocida parisii]|uniref:dTMP kinase n=1 Tax=Nematocida parisii (strain ERTm3) TaxID=935791 RepID=I3EJB7_NEMP3|nr:thymidylate kinase [Nematocida parisii ERTm1]EIJ89314.1 thymidylate kinase [Nematocida parisii ERTm3]KAI5142547.1 dTMP kinase [Nematocida parisii]EIJ92663.1 thymidylate kinase [Nematocida parisii ERTm1]KAI5155166.1 dTMP kinase [Nematocida parisii]KAI5155871.1 dTMP kinase [Nematocida parisii]|eukprot:XP_013060378.1 thymidylate kinase [Nematocida parisii ERTm1]
MASLFVVVEGIDRSGKSSLIKKLENSLISQGISTKVLNYPNRNNLTGKLISEILSGHRAFPKEVTHLLFSANRWEDKELLELSDYNVILCDRYVLSGQSYSIANGIPKEFAFASDKGIKLPDLTLFLDVSPEIAATREGYGEEVYEKKEFQQKVYTTMKDLLHLYTHEVIRSGTQESVHNEALKHILNNIQTRIK